MIVYRKIWIGVIGGSAEPIIHKLNRAHGAIQKEVMKRIVLKSTPVLLFKRDASAIRGVEIVNLLEEADKLPWATVVDQKQVPMTSSSFQLPDFGALVEPFENAEFMIELIEKYCVASFNAGLAGDLLHNAVRALMPVSPDNDATRVA